MPPKRKATRASKRNQKPEDASSEVSQVEVEEPPKKQSRRRVGKKKEPEPEPEPETEPEPTPELTPETTEVTPTKEVTKETIKQPKESHKNIISKPLPKKSTKPVSRIEEPLIPTSRIPSPMKSPVKRPSLAGRQPLDQKKTEQVINQTFLSKNIPKLTTIIDDLKNTKAELSFDELKASTETRFKASDDLINSLTAKNQQLLIELEEIKARLAQAESGESQSAANEQEEYENTMILDMLEQIVGLRIHKMEETDEALSFDCSQSGKNGVLDYKLTIPKEDSSEIIYTPINGEQELTTLKSCLPDYFFDDLTFPIDTLQQFYHKIYRGLNK